jgi:hypothetical protein
MKPMEPDQLQQHVYATYRSLRVGIAVIALIFPLLLWFGGAYAGIPLQESMSAYYHAASGAHTMRDWFTGILFAVGAFLYLYRGFSWQEDWALNFAGVFAVCVAVIPVPWNCSTSCKMVSEHTACAIAFFSCIAYVSLFRAHDTLHLLEDKKREARFRWTYRVTGALLIASPLTAVLLALVFMQLKSYVFFAELAGIWAFAFYWLAKSHELSITNADHLALRGLYRPREPG